jgi:hypothetical protein
MLNNLIIDSKIVDKKLNDIQKIFKKSNKNIARLMSRSKDKDKNSLDSIRIKHIKISMINLNKI